VKSGTLSKLLILLRPHECEAFSFEALSFDPFSCAGTLPARVRKEEQARYKEIHARYHVEWRRFFCFAIYYGTAIDLMDGDIFLKGANRRLCKAELQHGPPFGM